MEADSMSRYERLWEAASEARCFCELLNSHPASVVIHKEEQLLAREFRRFFPITNLEDEIDENLLKAGQNPQLWSDMSHAVRSLVTDCNLLTLLRSSPNECYTIQNTLIATKIQYLSIESARKQEGVHRICQEAYNMSFVEDGQKENLTARILTAANTIESPCFDLAKIKKRFYDLFSADFDANLRTIGEDPDDASAFIGGVCEIDVGLVHKSTFFSVRLKVDDVDKQFETKSEELNKLVKDVLYNRSWAQKVRIVFADLICLASEGRPCKSRNLSTNSAELSIEEIIVVRGAHATVVKFEDPLDIASHLLAVFSSMDI